MSHQLRQPRVLAQMRKVVYTLSPRGIQNDKTFHKGRFVIAPLAFLDGHVLLHAARQSQGTERLHHQRYPAQRGQGLLERLGIQFEQ